MANGTMNDYPVSRTTNIPSNLGGNNDEYGIIFGKWKNLFIGQWGAASPITYKLTVSYLEYFIAPKVSPVFEKVLAVYVLFGTILHD